MQNCVAILSHALPFSLSLSSILSYALSIGQSIRRFIVQAFNGVGAGPSSIETSAETFSNGKSLSNSYVWIWSIFY